MKKIISTALILLGIFIGCVIAFSIQMNRFGDDEVVQKTELSLPVASMRVADVTVNEMPGYYQELDELSMRETLTPLPLDRSLTLLLDTYGAKLGTISYQLTSPEDGSMLENGELTETSTVNGRVTVPFTINTALRAGTEYPLRFTVEFAGGGKAYYYTRLLQYSREDLAVYLAFAQNFAENCLEKMSSTTLSIYLEPDDTAANRSFYDVNIHSSADHASWGSLAPKLVRRAVPRICALNDTTASIALDYILSAEDSEGNTELYSVSDYYRLRLRSNSKVALLDFDRCAEQIFDGRLPAVSENGLRLGVQDPQLSFRANEDTDIAAFVVNGDLWSYSQNNGHVTRLFGFRGENAMGGSAASIDPRTESKAHDIIIGQVGETGDVSFVVYGYMAAGSHEGHMGISVCNFIAAENMVEERLFLPLDQSYPVLQKNVSRLSYVSSGGYLYLFLGTEVCRISLNNGAYSVIQDGIAPDCFFASGSGRTVAWTAGDGSSAVIRDLENGKTYAVQAPEGELIAGGGFLNEDFVYGLVHGGDTVIDSTGRRVSGIYELTILGIDGTVRKTYSREDRYITDVEQEANGLLLTLSEKEQEGVFRTVGTDRIIVNEESGSRVRMDSLLYSRTGEQMQLKFPMIAASADQQMVEAAITYTDSGSQTVVEWPEETGERYFVYGKGRLQKILYRPNLAVQAAEAVSGLVLNERQMYVWERGNWASSYTIDTSRLPAAILRASCSEESLTSAAGDGLQVLDLTGCLQDDLKYFLSKGCPVFAATSRKGDFEILVGYDVYNFWVYREGEAPEPVATDDMELRFAEGGNVFFSYMNR